MDAIALPTIVRRTDLAALGLPRHQLYALAKAGELEQIAPGVYAKTGELDDTTATWASISLRKPAATICLLSALSLHELTDEIPRETDIALPRGVFHLEHPADAHGQVRRPLTKPSSED